MPEPDIWVVIPAFNESRWIEPTLAALAAQDATTPFAVLVVDNNSSDDTAEVVTRAMEEHPGLDLRIISEIEKGTGAACDTGMRHAIANGATYLLRTDADSIPAVDWVRTMHACLDDEGLDLVGGRVAPRRDDGTAFFGASLIGMLSVWSMRYLGRFNPINRGDKFLGPWTMIPGFNLGLTATAYEASGGFPRSRIDDTHEDWEITNRVREVSERVRYRRAPLVRYSNRRAQRHGVVNVIRWYLRHDGPVLTHVDVR